MCLDRKKWRESEGREREGDKISYLDNKLEEGRKGREMEGTIFPPPLINTFLPKLERFGRKKGPSLSLPFPSSIFLPFLFPSTYLSKHTLSDFLSFS